MGCGVLLLCELLLATVTRSRMSVGGVCGELCVVCLGSNKDPAVVRCMGRRITSGPDSVCFLADATILKAMQLAIRISTYSVRKLILLYTAMYNWMIIHKWTENIFVLFLVLSSD